MASGGISGTAVAVATGGAVLIYAGFRGVNPAQALRDVASGKAPAVEATSAGLTAGGGAGVIPAGYVPGSGVGGRLVQAAMQHRSEKYSQARRWQPGFSDCSSFVGKALKDIGITPPGASVTGSYLVWRGARTVPRSQIREGDLLVSGGHIVIAMSGGQAIGQQNGRQNVQIGPISSLMSGQPGWIARRITVGGSSSKGEDVTRI